MKFDFLTKEKAAPLLPQTGRSGAAGLAAWNRWRDSYNPLTGLTLQTAINYLNSAQSGDTASAQWLYQLIERRDPDLLCCVESTVSAMCELNWYIKTCEGDPRHVAAWDDKLAADQAAVLLDFHNRILNVNQGIEHLAMSLFRGYAHVQIRADNAWLENWNPLHTWNVARDGFDGAWLWNPNASSNSRITSQAKSNELDPANYLILTNRRPVDEIGLIKYLRSSLSWKDWDAFVEIYGIPRWLVIEPPGVTPEQRPAFLSAAESLSEGADVTLPNGSQATPAAPPPNNAPFETHLKYWSEALVRCATGGLLTSLSLPQGIGAGASSAHSETFSRLARARAARISEEVQRKIDAPILKAAFPGKPILAYWSLDAREEMDVTVICNQIASLSQSYTVDPAQIQELTGYRVTPKMTAPPPVMPAPALASRAAPVALSAVAAGVDAALTNNATKSLAAAVSDDLAPLRDRIEAALSLQDDDAMMKALIELRSDLPGILAKIISDPSAAQVIEQSISAALLNGIADGEAQTKEDAKP
jgi:phage gp29-like protein